MCPYPLQEIAIRIKPLAIRKDLAQASSGAIGKIGKKHAGRSVAVAKKGEIDRGIRKFRLRSEDLQIFESVIFKNDEAREMQGIEFAKRHELIRRFGNTQHILSVHAPQKGTKLHYALARDWR
jgi:hypothetical protein